MKIILIKYSFIASLFFSGLAIADPNILKVGVVPQFEQRQIFRNWKPLLLELEKLTGLKLELVGSSKIPEFEQQFNSGLYDIAYMNPYHVLKADETQGYIPLFRDKKNIKGILVVNNESTIKKVEELNNKFIAFPAPNALGASLLIRSSLTEKFGIRFKPSYVQTHSSVYFHVAKKLVSAGGGVDRTFSQQPSALRKKLRIIYTTPEIVSHPIVIHPRITKKIRTLLSDGLVNLFNTNRGKALFKGIPITDLVKTNIREYTSLTKFNLDKYYEK